MSLGVYKVRENKCPICGEVGLPFDGEKVVVNSFGTMMVQSEITWQCLNEDVHSDQILFGYKKLRKATQWDLVTLNYEG